MKTKIIIIILCILFLLLVIAGFLLYRNYKNKKLIEINEKLEQREKELEERNKIIKELQDKPLITIKEYIKLTDKEKEKAYIELIEKYNIAIEQINKDTILLKEDEKIINELKGMIDTKKGWGINGFVAGGLEYEENNKFKPEILIGATIEKTFDIRIFKTGIEFGGYGKIYEDKGAGLILGFKVSW